MGRHVMGNQRQLVGNRQWLEGKRLEANFVSKGQNLSTKKALPRGVSTAAQASPLNFDDWPPNHVFWTSSLRIQESAQGFQHPFFMVKRVSIL